MAAESDKVFELFNQLSDVPVADRSTHLDQLCGDDKDLRQQVQQLISRAESDTGWMTEVGQPDSEARIGLNETKAIPEKIGSYQLLRRIGQGGMGDVYEAFHTELDRVVALKTMRLDHSESESFVSRFKRERKLVAQVDSPHVVRVTDAGYDSGVHFLVMERLQGNDLKSVVDASGPMSPRRAAEVIRQSLIGLAAINQSGLVHRDVKPSNLFLDQDGRIKILDLGIAKSQTSLQSSQSATLTLDNHIVGTPDFLAPEQAQGVDDPDIRADIYALGCVWYFLLTGQPPYSGERFPNAFMKVSAHVNEPFPSTAELPIEPFFRELIAQMTAKRREDRPRDPAVLAEQIEAQNGRFSLVGQELIDTSTTRSDATAVTHVEKSAPSLSRRQILIAGASVVAIGGAGIIWRVTKSGTINGGSSSSSSDSGQPPANESERSEEAALTQLVLRNPGLKRTDFSYGINESGSPAFESNSRSLKDISSIVSLPLEIFMIDNSGVVSLGPLASKLNLQVLQCTSSNTITSLEPIKTLSLTNLQIHGTRVSDLGPVKDMQLTYLDCHQCPVGDLSRLNGMPLRYLDAHDTKISDLGQLGVMDQLDFLDCTNTQVSDLKPLMEFPVLETVYASERVLQASSFLVDHPNASKLKCNDKTLSALFPNAN